MWERRERRGARFSRALSTRCQPYQLLALAVSLSVHLALSFSVHAGGSTRGGVSPGPRPSNVLTVELSPIGETVYPAVSRGAVDAGQNEKPPVDLVVNAAPQRQQMDETPSLLAIAKPAEPHYFESRELTQKPLIMQDVPADLVLDLPDVPVQAAVLRMLINEYGDIDQVIVVNSLLPDFARQMVVDAFAKTRFHPGRINGLPVKSQIRIEIMLENAANAEAQ